MKHKKLLVVGVAAALSMTAVNAMALFGGWITLTGQNLPGSVNVICHSNPALYPIPANGSLIPLPYSLIRKMFGEPKAQNVTMHCSFSIGGNPVGTAQLYIGQNNNNMKVLAVNPAAGYSVTVDSSGTPVSVPTGNISDLSVTLSH